MATIYTVVNWTTKKSTGPFETKDAAEAGLADLMSTGDEYTIWALPQQVGAATPVAEGRYQG